jgi:hypothetical protein
VVVVVARVKLYQMVKVAAERHLSLHRFVLPMVRGNRWVKSRELPVTDNERLEGVRV